MRFFRRKQDLTPESLSLQEAVDRGLVTFELRGVGVGVTSKVRIRITKLTDAPLRITIPKGTEFMPTMGSPKADDRG
jgi:hypothetical protein